MLALATPATLAAAGPEYSPKAATATARPSDMTPVEFSLKKATDAAVTVLLAERQTNVPAPVTTPRTNRGLRAQSTGGGSKTGMIMGLVYTALGVGASVYAYRMIQDQTKDAIDEAN